MAAPELPTNIVTPSERNVVFAVDGRPDGEGYLTKAGAGSKTGLVLIQEWWGLNKSITITAEIFAEQGFLVLCPDIYRGKVAKNHEEAGHLLGGLDFVGAVQDIRGAVLHLKKLGCSKVGITGFCMGGALTVAAACSFSDADAVVPFYGIPDTSKV
jgi:carboxymethylenebutenolidase